MIEIHCWDCDETFVGDEEKDGQHHWLCQGTNTTWMGTWDRGLRTSSPHENSEPTYEEELGA